MIARWALALCLAAAPLVAQDSPTSDRLNVGLRSVADTSMAYPYFARLHLTVVWRYDRAVHLRITPDSTPADVLSRLVVLKDSLGIFTYAEWDEMLPSEELTDSGDMAAANWGLAALRVAAPWDRGIRGQGVIVSIHDTGIETQHPEFGGRVTRCVAFTQSGIDSITPNACRQTVTDCKHHGTHVTSSAAGGTRGVALEAEIFALKIFEDVSGDCLAWASARIASLYWAINHRGDKRMVVNYSTGSGTGLGSERTAVEMAEQAGVIVVGAAGNSGSGALPLYPGAFARALSIGGVTSSLARASYSNVGPLLDFMGPGSGIDGAIGASSYGSKSGTSMASPHIAGVVALMLSANPLLLFDQVYAMLQQCSKDMSTAGFDNATGWGFPRADCAVALAQGLSIQPMTTAVPLRFTPDTREQCAPVRSTVAWTTGPLPAWATVSLLTADQLCLLAAPVDAEVEYRLDLVRIP